MLLRTALLFFAISLFCFGADNGIQLKGIKSVENREIQFFIKKGENIDTKSKEIIDMERVSAVSKFYPIKISGNGNDTIQMKAFENERAKLKIVRENTSGWEVEERGDDVYIYRTTASFAVKDETKKVKKNITQNLKIDRESYREGEYQKVKLYLSGEGYYAFFVIYDNMSIRFIEPPASNKARYIDSKGDTMGEWELLYVTKPEKSGREQLLYSVISKEYIDFEEKIGGKVMELSEFVKLMEDKDILSETVLKYYVDEKE